MKVSEVIRILEDDGWYVARQSGSHRQFKHVTKKGLVTVAGKPSHDLSRKTLASIWRQAQCAGGQGEGDGMSKYLVIIEEAGENFSAYSPDVPGCVATGDTRDETVDLMRDAMTAHLKGLREEGLPIPPPTTSAEYLAVAI